jgi:hypothetical protein
VAWKRDTVVLTGGVCPGRGVLVDGSGKLRSSGVEVGVGGGEIKATFLWTSLVPVVLKLAFVVFRDTRSAESCSLRGYTAVRAAMSGSVFSTGKARGTRRGGVGVGVERGSLENEGGGSSAKGRISGNGLKEAIETGVEVAR